MNIGIAPLLATTGTEILAWLLVIVIGGTGLVAVLLTSIAAVIVGFRWLWYDPSEAGTIVKKIVNQKRGRSLR